MGKRNFFQKSDSPAVLRAAIKQMEGILETLQHRNSRSSVLRSLNGLKSLYNSYDLKNRDMSVLREQRKQKDRLSSSSSTHAFHRWTDDEDKLVMESPMLDFEIGKELGRSRAAVAKRRFVLRESKKVLL